jgi:hypothetical protein
MGFRITTSTIATAATTTTITTTTTTTGNVQKNKNEQNEKTHALVVVLVWDEYGHSIRCKKQPNPEPAVHLIQIE